MADTPRVTVPVRGPGHCEDDLAWAEFVRQYDGQPRSRPYLTDFALANRVFMADRNDLDLIVWQTAAKERIRWLSIELAKAQSALLSSLPAEGAAVDERLKWFLKVIESAGGEVCSTESRHNPINVFCEDRNNGDDTFNISEGAGYTQTSHDTSFDTSTTRITDKGRAYLAALATREETSAEAGVCDQEKLPPVFGTLYGDKITSENFEEAIQAELPSVLRTQPPAREDAQPVADAVEPIERAVAALRGHIEAIQVAKAGGGSSSVITDCVNGLPEVVRWIESGLFNVEAVFEQYENTHPAPDALRGAVADIAAERQRQIDAEGQTPEADDGYLNGELAAAASAYAFSAATRTRYLALDPLGFWPWSPEWFKPKDQRSDLVRAGALIVAEIERLDRQALPALQAEQKGGAA